MKIVKIPYILLCLVIIACGGSDSSDGTPVVPTPEPVASPLATTLVFPENNKECTEGEIKNESQSIVNFQWNNSENTDSYEVHLKNLNTNNTSKTNANSNSINITLERGVPYEWFVISKAAGTNETASSTKWRFYNQGLGVENYAPFPAEVVMPKRGANLSPTTNVALEWIGNDIDNDITEYEIFLDINTPPTILLGSTLEQTINAMVTSNQIYYWRVISIDSRNNKSTSEIFEFKIN